MEQQKKNWGCGAKILIGLGIIFVIGIIASQSDKSDQGNASMTSGNSTTESSSSNSNDDTPEYKKIGDQIDVGNFSYVVNSAQYAKTIGDEFSQTKADGVFLIVSVTFRNNDNEEHTLDNSFFKLTDEAGTEFESSTDGETALEMAGKQTLFLKQCNPQITKSGLLIFEVPDKKIYDLHLSGGFWSGKTAVVKLTTN